MLKLILMRLKLYGLYKKEYKIMKKGGQSSYYSEKIKELEEDLQVEESRHFYNQSCFVWCPKCHQDLVSSNSLIEDTNYVYYECSRCHHKSKWDFDCFAPILINETIILKGEK